MGVEAGLDIAVDWRLLLAVGAMVLGGVTKSLTGLGVPVIALPILTALYGSLTEMIVVTIVSTVLSDIYFIVRERQHWREAPYLVPLLLFGVIGIVVGAQILIRVPDWILSGALGIVLTAFVITSWLGTLPTFSDAATRRLSPVMGFIGGALQGSTGASGPVVTMYLFNAPISKGGFLFAVNFVFFVLDVAQVTTLQRLGLYTPGRTQLALLATVPLAVGMVAGVWLSRRVDPVVFRRGVLVVLAITALTLFGRVLQVLW
jgi:uncharacterized protein